MKTYECEIISPMFAHGADPKEFELRATEIKGGMRFWFRTALSSKLKNNKKALKFIESYIFGDTSQKSKVIVSVDGKLNQKTSAITGIKFKPLELKNLIDPIKYIAYGMYDNGQWHAYADQGIFNINLSFLSIKKDGSVNKEEVDEIESICDNLILLYSTFGGIGAKSDKGFGSFQVKSMEFNPDNLSETAKKAVEKIYNNSKSIFERIKPKDMNFDAIEFSSKLPTYPFFNPSDEERYGHIQLKDQNYVNALSTIGKKYYTFRREVEGDGEFNRSYKKKGYEAKRALLGLPILYRQPKLKINITLENSEGRKTSTLHMSLKRYNSKYHLIYVFLPSMIGENNKLEAEGKEITPSSDFKSLYSKFKHVWGVNK